MSRTSARQLPLAWINLTKFNQSVLISQSKAAKMSFAMSTGRLWITEKRSGDMIGAFYELPCYHRSGNLGTTLLSPTSSIHLMYVRVKRVGSRRYAYLVKGVRAKERVRQKTLCYLGPVAKLGFGIPNDIRSKTEQRF